MRLCKVFNFLSIMVLVGVVAPTKSYSEPGTKLFIYKIEVTNAPQSKADKVSLNVANFLADKRLQNGCVDLRSLGSDETDHVLHATIGVVLRQEIKQSDIAELKSGICGTFNGCKVDVNVESFPVENVQVVSVQNEDRPSRPYNPPKEKATLDADTAVPTFSRACVSGKYSDSWNDAASTGAARRFLSNIGITIERSRTLQLDVAGGKSDIWTFGFPDHSRDASATEAQKGAKEGLH